MIDRDTTETQGSTLSERLAGARGVVLDIDGCLLLSTEPAGETGTPLPGAAEAVDDIRASGRAVVAFTNASSRSPAEISASMLAMGIDVGPSDVLTPSVVAADTVLRRYGGGPVLALGGDGVVDVLAAAGADLVNPGDGRVVRVVVVGWDEHVDRAKVQAAAEALWAGADLLVTSDATAFATTKGRTVGLAGFLAAGLAHIGGRPYEVLGKPSDLAVASATAHLGVMGRELLVAGDDLGLEVAMARRAGGVGALVTTGMHSRADADAATPDRRPDLVVDSLRELVDAVRESDASVRGVRPTSGGGG